MSEPPILNPDTLIAVSAYAGDCHQVENNLGTYLHHGCPVVIFSPTDAPITSVSDPRAICLQDGLRGWAGPHTLQRHVKFLQLLLKFPQNLFLFHDADSVCLSPGLPRYLYESPDLVWSNEVIDTNPGPSYLPKIAMQPPYFLSRTTVEKLLAANSCPATSYYGEPISPDGWPMPFPTECIDHYMLQLTYGAGLAHRSFFTGASFETASSTGLETMSELVRAHGKVLLHSIKTKPILDRLLGDYHIWRHFNP